VDWTFSLGRIYSHYGYKSLEGIMITLYHDDSMLRQAIIDSEKIGALKDSFTEGQRQWAGLLGEYAVKNHFKNLLKDTENFYNNDLTIGKYKVEVKSKLHKFELRDDYEWSIAKTSKHQKPDYYFFVSVHCNEINLRDIQDVYLAGYISHKDFWDKAVFYKKGTQHSNGFVSPVDHYNIFQNELDKFKEEREENETKS